MPRCVSTARRVPSGAVEPSATRSGPALVAWVVATVVAVDQATKAWAAAELADGPISIVGSTIELRLSRNTGGAFSLFRGFTPVLAVLTIGVAVLLVRAVRHAEDRVTLGALALVLGGAIGNLVDRAARSPGFLRGAVVDFVKVDSWPIFNVADASITVGALVLVLWSLRPRNRRAGDDDGTSP